MIIKKIIFFILFCSSLLSLKVEAEEKESTLPLYQVHFEEIPAAEFIRFVGKVAKENFIFNKEDLAFPVSFSAEEGISAEEMVGALLRVLHVHKFSAEKEGSYILVQKGEGGAFSSGEGGALFDSVHGSGLHTYKLQYHEGTEIVDALRQMAVEGQAGLSLDVVQAIQSLQWVKMTNSLLFSASVRAAKEMEKIISSLDAPLKQMFIEILVIETDIRKGLDFGLEWAFAGKYKDRVAGAMGSFGPKNPGGHFLDGVKGPGGLDLPGIASKVPFGSGFDLGIIGDIITHQGRSFLSLGSLVSALELDGDSTIVLNQKIITQDNKLSRIFVGDNIPFTGSVVTTVGQGQQTTANIEYRDVGVSLNITPKVGQEDVITLSLDEEITEAVFDHQVVGANTGGIRTTKTNMQTHAHVPDQHFLILSGMIRNAKTMHKTGIPCLGGLPLIGSLFSKTKKQDEKRNVIVFVRPQIIHSFDQYKQITEAQEATYKSQANGQDFQDGLELVQR